MYQFLAAPIDQETRDSQWRDVLAALRARRTATAAELAEATDIPKDIVARRLRERPDVATEPEPNTFRILRCR